MSATTAPNPTIPPTLQVDSLRLVRGATSILDGVSLQLRAGQWLALCGPNGAGKSTLIACVAGDQRPSRGLMRLQGEDITRLSDVEQARRRAVLVQMPALASPFPALGVVALGYADARRDVCLALLEELGIGHLAQRSYLMLSGGERRLVQLARVLLQADHIAAARPDALLLLDEPTAHLDPVMSARALRALGRRVGNGMAVLMASHDLELASRHADRMLLLRRGEAVADRDSSAISAADLQACFETPVRIHRSDTGPGMRIEFPAVVDGAEAD